MSTKLCCRKDRTVPLMNTNQGIFGSAVVLALAWNPDHLVAVRGGAHPGVCSVTPASRCCFRFDGGVEPGGPGGGAGGDSAG